MSAEEIWTESGKVKSIIEGRTLNRSSVEESEHELASFMLQAFGALVDRWGVALLLEVNGVQDVQALVFGKQNVFQLADEISDRCKSIIASSPELTVSMPAYNAATWIETTILSVLSQDYSDFELVVVDDGSTDRTAEVVAPITDKRVRLIRNGRRMGLAYCHNLVIKQSWSPFIAHVDETDVVLPGAFRKIIDTLKSSPSIGQVRCPYYHVNEKGRPTRDSFRRSCKEVSKKTNKKRRHKRNLVVHGPTMNHLQAYRRDALQVVGQFNEKIKEYFSYEMALRIASRYEVRQIPEFLCAVRLPSSNGGRPTLYSRIKFFGYRLYLIYQLRKGSDVRYLKERTYNPIWLFFLLLGRGLGELWEGWVESAAKVFRSRIMSF